MGLCYRTIYGQGADKSTYAGEGGRKALGVREVLIVILHDFKGLFFTCTRSLTEDLELQQS